MDMSLQEAGQASPRAENADVAAAGIADSCQLDRKNLASAPDIGVFYLARLKEGFDRFEDFAASYRKHNPGIPHELVLIAKGFSKRSEYHLLSTIFEGIPHTVISVPDDIGQDIQSYRAAAARSQHPVMCFFNTFSRVNASDWLKKLYNAIMLPGVGMAGATGSYESLYNSNAAIHRFLWMSTNKVAFDRPLAAQFEWLLGVGLTPRNLKIYKSWSKRMRKRVRDIVSRRPAYNQILDRGDLTVGCWGNDPAGTSNFPGFPNPHIRSNAFMVRREDFLSVGFGGGSTKMGGNEFECGHDGLSATIARSGRRLVVAGADGQAFDIEQWPESNTFRSGNQSNLLASDNRTDEFLQMSPAVKETHRIFTWGEYSPDGPGRLLGVPFDKKCDVKRRFVPRGSRLCPKFSVVLPTHNGGRLAGDAIKTVLNQSYSNFEVLVFDNASKDPIAPIADEFQDSRVRCERSDEFLPVTDSWNRAFDMAQGDYVIMIGDDDGLCPWYFERAADLISTYEEPDAIYSSLYQFWHPGVLRSEFLGAVRSHATGVFMEFKDYPFLLDEEGKRQNVDNSLQNRRSFIFNMPCYTCKQSLLSKIRGNGPLMQPPFPDYYFGNLVFSMAERLLIEPRPLAFQGISRKSFGCTLFNGKSEDGFKVLGHSMESDPHYARVRDALLPVSEYQNQYLLTMLRVAGRLGDPARQPGLDRYRKLQIIEVLRRASFSVRWSSTPLGRQVYPHLSVGEKLWASWIALLARASRKKFFGRHIRVFFDRIDQDLRTHTALPSQVTLNSGDFVDGYEFYQALADGRIPEFRI